MKKIILVLLLSLGIVIGVTVNNVYAKYILDKSINAVSLETSTLYSIDYDLNGGTISGASSKYTINYSLTLPQPSKQGYTFSGWTGSNGSTPIKNVIIEKGTTGNLSYVANWTPINYTISYNFTGGTLNSPISNYNIETNTFTLGIPTRLGYEFTGWTGSNGTQANKTVSVVKGTIGNLSYVANWTPINYTISYNFTGGTLSSPISNYNIETNTFTLGTPTRVGYDFVGWTGSNGTQANKTVSVAKGTIGNLSYVANWTPINYTISYNLDGGTLNSPISNYNIETNTFTLGTPTRVGYDFVGWTGSNGTQANKTVNVSKGTTGNLSYKANWNLKNFTVTYLNSDGSYYSSTTVNYNSTIPNIGYGVDQVHIFNGWFYNGQNINNVRMPESNISVVASVREVNGYIITGQATDGDTSRIARFAELISHKGLGGYWQQEASGYYSYVSNWSNYSHIMDTANYLMNNAQRNSWPYLRWLVVSFENGYTIQLR